MIPFVFGESSLLRLAFGSNQWSHFERFSVEIESLRSTFFLGFCLLFDDCAVETLMVRELVLFLREFAIGKVVGKVEVCVFLFFLTCWLGLFLGGRPRVFPVRLCSFAVAILGGPFVSLGDVVESGFINARFRSGL